MYVFEIDPQDMKVYVVSSVAQAGGPSVSDKSLTSSANEPTFSVNPSETIAATLVFSAIKSIFFSLTPKTDGNIDKLKATCATDDVVHFLQQSISVSSWVTRSHTLACVGLRVHQLLHLQVKTSLNVLPVFVLIVPTRMGELTLTSKRHLQLFTGWCEKKGPPHTGHSRHRTIST
jgi:hypothetical protein